MAACQSVPESLVRGIPFYQALFAFFYVCHINNVKSLPLLNDEAWHILFYDAYNVFGRELLLIFDRGCLPPRLQVDSEAELAIMVLGETEVSETRIWIWRWQDLGKEIADAHPRLFEYLLIAAKQIPGFLGR
jgi:hypothetical protein